MRVVALRVFELSGPDCVPASTRDSAFRTSSVTQPSFSVVLVRGVSRVTSLQSSMASFSKQPANENLTFDVLCYVCGCVSRVAACSDVKTP